MDPVRGATARTQACEARATGEEAAADSCEVRAVRRRSQQSAAIAQMRQNDGAYTIRRLQRPPQCY